METSAAGCVHLLFLFLFFGQCCSYKILILAPTPAISHQKPFQALTKVLLERGHQVTFFTANPLKIPHENLTELDVSVAYNLIGELDFYAMNQQSPVESLALLRDPSTFSIPLQLSEPAVQEFIRQNHTFDLAIIERLGYQALYGLIHRVGSPPLVGMITLTAIAPLYHALGNPMNPAYAPEVWLGFSDHMSFWQRAYNAYFYLRFYYIWYYQIMPTQEGILRKYFGQEPPSVYETEGNFSLLIANNHFCLEYPRTHLPNVVEITGVHLETQTKPLPKDIQEWMDGAEHGVIYLSLGSNVRSDTMPAEKIRAFLEAFQQLPQRILWKWESDVLPGQPANVMVRKWLPQQDVLAHPSVRLFITQGGLQSMNEATYHAVPFLVIPIFSDQAHNAAKIVQAEIGVRLELSDITKDTLLNSIRAVLQDSKYKKNMKRLSAIFREHKAESVDKAVWWIEYVVRHKGAPHLRSAALDLHWWQLLLLDVAAFVLVSAFFVAYTSWYLLRKIVARVGGTTQKLKTK